MSESENKKNVNQRKLCIILINKCDNMKLKKINSKKTTIKKDIQQHSIIPIFLK